MPEAPFTVYCVTAPVADGAAGNRSFRGHDRDGRAVVLHLVDADAAARQRIERQAAAAAKLDPMLVCRVLESGPWCHRVLLVEEDGRGELLRARLRHGPLAVRDLVEAGVQLCEAVESAHRIGLIHAGLASDCIYLAPGNQVRLAGFGFAALLRGLPACVAPEALRGVVDRRVDIYAIGAVLWEMATGETAPADPMPATQLRRDLPLIVDGIIRTALEPEAGKRFQTAAGIAQALRHFQDGTATPEKLTRAVSEGPSPRRRRRRVHRPEPKWASRMKWVRRVAAVALVCTLAFAVYVAVRSRETYRKTTVTPLTASGDVVAAAVSPDASHIALVRREVAGYSLWIQSASGKDPVRLTPAAPEKMSSVAFHPSGSRIYFVSGEPGVLHTIGTNGGTVESLARNVAAPRFAADGKKIAFLRVVGTEESVFIANSDGTGETVALSRAAPAILSVAAWERGGGMFALGLFTPGEGSQVLVTHLDGSFSQLLGWHQWPGVIDAAWLPGGDAVMVSGPERGGDGRIWKVLFPEGVTTPLVGGGDYSGVSLSKNGKTLVTVRTSRLSSLWVVPARDPRAARQITRGEGPDGVFGLDWVGPDRIVYTSEDERGRGLWVIDSQGKTSGAILREADRSIAPRASPDGVVVAFIRIQEKARRLWTVSLDGKDLRDVARTGMQAGPCFGPDPRTVYYHAPTAPALAIQDPGSRGIWKMPVEGGRSERVVPEPSEHLSISPDGGRIAFRGGGQVLVANLPAGEVVKRIPGGEPGDIGWTPDGKAIVWTQSEGESDNLWAHPLDGGDAYPVTRFATPGRIRAFAWSRDGQTIAVSRGRDRSDAVMLHDKGW